jgi:hypothetical protein
MADGEGFERSKDTLPRYSRMFSLIKSLLVSTLNRLFGTTNTVVGFVPAVHATPPPPLKSEEPRYNLRQRKAVNYAEPEDEPADELAEK